ncbi:nucleotide exchange factor GrpE [Aquibacillus albus]|uniref:Protein GrpE n=1 Tax=Aquibacillus albus TaxID=1168171 RepID=A0ABS2MUQ4_9BACI|nr:molecular chaperone GrpE [Aquibacillus albus]
MAEKDHVQEAENQEESVEEVEQELVEEDENSDAKQEASSRDSDLEVEKEKEALIKEKEELYQRLLRVQAEYDNFRKRTQREKESDLKYKSQSIVTELLPVVDNFERALNVELKDESANSFVEGMEMVYRQLTDTLKKEGVEEIKTEGEQFDPHLHQAVMQVEDDQYDSNVIVEELQKGYKLKDRVIRPAMVKVNQ